MSNLYQKRPKAPEKIKLEEDEGIINDDSSKASFEIQSQIIKIPYINLFQHSRIIQDEIKHNDIFERLSTKLKDAQTQHNIKDDHIITFFRLLNNEEVELKAEEIANLIKLTDLFKIHSLSSLLKKLIRKHLNDFEFILDLKISQEENEDENLFSEDDFSVEMEKCLSEKINECLESEKIAKISVSSVYRMIEKTNRDQLNSDFLYRFISESIEERHVLFRFLDFEKLSDESLSSFCDKYERDMKEENISFYEFLPCNVNYIKKLRDKQKLMESHIQKLEEKLKELENKNKDLSISEEKNKHRNDELNKINQQLKIQMNDTIKQKDDEIDKLNKANQQLKAQMNDTIKQKDDEIITLNKTNQQLKTQMNDTIKQKDDEITKLNKINQQLKTQMNDTIKQKDDVMAKLNKINQFETEKKEEYSSEINIKKILNTFIKMNII